MPSLLPVTKTSLSLGFHARHVTFESQQALNSTSKRTASRCSVHELPSIANRPEMPLDLATLDEPLPSFASSALDFLRSSSRALLVEGPVSADKVLESMAACRGLSVRPSRAVFVTLVDTGGSPALLRFPFPIASGDDASESRWARGDKSSGSALVEGSSNVGGTGNASGRFGGGDDVTGGGESLSGEQICGMRSWKGEWHGGADVS